MKRAYSKIMMLVMIIAALGFTTCGGDDEEGKGNQGNNSCTTIVIDGEKYYAANCHAEQTHRNGMFLVVNAVTDVKFPFNGHELVAHISPCAVADLKEGQVFDSENIRIQTLRGLSEVVVNNYQWDVLSGSISIKKITKMEMTIQLNSLQLEHIRTRVKHTISGTAVLNSGVYSSGGPLLSFDDVLK